MSEIKTMLQVVRKHKADSGLKNVTVIADRGLNCKLNLQHLAEEGFDYIAAQSVSRLKKDVKERVLSEENWEHSERYHEDVFKMKRLDAGTHPRALPRLLPCDGSGASFLSPHPHEGHREHLASQAH